MSAKLWYEDVKALNKTDILLSSMEVENVFDNYKILINFDEEKYFYNNFRKYEFIEFLDDDYSNECRTDSYIHDFIKKFDYLYAIPIVFSYDEFENIKNERISKR